MIANDVTIDIPLNEEDEHECEHEHEHDQHGHDYHQHNQHNQEQQNQNHQEHDQDRTDAHSKSDSLSFFRYPSSVHNEEEGSEKTHLVPDCDASSTGRRRKSKPNRTNNPTHTSNPNYNYNPNDYHHTEHPSNGNKNLTRLHRLYKSLINSSIITRYIVYITPLAILIAIPIIVGATAARYATIGGVTLYWFFAWIEVIWLSLWVCKIVARGLPYVFQSLWGVVSPGGRRYGLVLRALEIPISLVGWTGVSLITFFPVCSYAP